MPVSAAARSSCSRFVRLPALRGPLPGGRLMTMCCKTGWLRTFGGAGARLGTGLYDIRGMRQKSDSMKSNGLPPCFGGL